jgi:hypothetical protein
MEKEKQNNKPKEQLYTHAWILIVSYSALFMDCKNSLLSKAARERIATAASPLVGYDLVKA